jgi:hypothetical protein
MPSGLGTWALATFGFSLALVSPSLAQVTATPNHLAVTRSLRPDYPDAWKASGLRVVVRVRATLRADGSVETARRTGARVEKSMGLGSDEKILSTLFPSAISAARGWIFENPSNPLPASVDIMFDFHDGIVSSTFSGH